MSKKPPKEEVVKDVNLTRIEEPKALSLVGLPANQTAFKVLRKDDGTDPVPAASKTRRARRSDPLLSIAFEDGVTEEEAAAIMEEYGLAGYSIKTVEDGHVVVTRSDADKVADQPTVTVNIGNGRKATILQTFAKAQRGLTLTSVSFEKDYFAEPAEAVAWLQSRSIDFDETRVDNGDVEICVARKDVPEGAETRRLKIDDGVTVTVIRSDGMDMPDCCVEVVNEAAYGCWGWGQLDFSAAVADIEFCEVASEAVYVLRDVVNRILFYSDLPVAVRKELVVQATSQFANFIGTLLDALPARVVLINRHESQENPMSKTKETPAGTAAQRSDETPPAGAAPAAGDSPAAGDTAPAGTTASITRDDVVAIVNETLAPLAKQIGDMATAVTALAQRGDAPAAAQAAPAPASQEPAAGQQQDTLTAILRSVESLSETVKGVGDRVERLEGSSVVRSDGADKKPTQAKRDDVFKGVFGGTAAAAK